MECFALKMVHVGLMVRVQGDTKEFQCITVYGRKDFKMDFNMFILYEIK